MYWTPSFGDVDDTIEISPHADFVGINWNYR